MPVHARVLQTKQPREKPSRGLFVVRRHDGVIERDRHSGFIFHHSAAFTPPSRRPPEPCSAAPSAGCSADAAGRAREPAARAILSGAFGWLLCGRSGPGTGGVLSGAFGWLRQITLGWVRCL